MSTPAFGNPADLRPVFGDATELPLAVDAETALAGVLMHLDSSRAAWVLDGLDDDDVGNRQLAVVFKLARRLATRAVDPTPAAIVAEARLSGEVTGRERLSILGRVVLDAYTTPASSNGPLAEHYRLCVLGDALGRHLIEAAERLTQAAEQLPPEQRGRVITRAVADLSAAWRRWQAAGGEPDERRAVA